MGVLDRSKSVTQSTTTNLNQTDARSYGFQGVEGPAVATEGDVEIRIDQVDSGIVAAARELGSGALALSGDVVASALRANSDVAHGAFDIAGESLYAVKGIAGDSIAAQNRITEYSTGQVASVARDALSFGRGLADSAIDTLSNAIGKAADATRTDSANVLNNVVKYGAIAIGIVAAVFLLKGKKI